MKIGIIGDTHFGAGFNLGKTDPKTQLNTRLLDFGKTFNRIVDDFLAREVKVAVITGDIFETRHPTSAQLNIFSKCISRANNLGLQIVMVVGNHDQQRTIATTTIDVYQSLKISEIKVFSKIGTWSTKDKYGNDVHITLMPYRDRRMMGANNSAEAIASLRSELDEELKNLTGTKIIVGHFMVDRAVTGQDGEEFSMSEIVLPSDMFANVNAVVMGHVHQHEVLKKRDPFIAYVGSMEKIDFGERRHAKVSIILDTDNMGKPEILSTKVRELYAMDFDYSEGTKHYANKITDQMIIDIEKFHMKYNLKNAIVKWTAKVKSNDLYHTDVKRVKEYILSKGVKNLCGIQATATSSRQLRNKHITEEVNGKVAMASYLKSLNEPEQVKKKLLKSANNIIEEVEGK